MKYSLERRKQISGILMITPSIIVLAVFVLYPICNSLILSLFDYNLLKGVREFTELSNYRLIATDTRFWQSLWHTCYFTLGYVPMLTVLALLLALILNRSMQRGVKFFQAVMFLPAITSMAIVAIGWRYILDPNIGIVFGVLNQLGIRSVALLQDTKLAMPTVCKCQAVFSRVG